MVFQDDAVDAWYVGKPTRAEAQQAAAAAERSWNVLGLHKWLLYERDSGALVGRGGLSTMRLRAYDGAIRRFLPPDAWADEGVGDNAADPLARRWAEIGWALRGPYWGRGYAAEVGRAGLRFAFDELDLRAVVSFTERINCFDGDLRSAVPIWCWAGCGWRSLPPSRWGLWIHTPSPDMVGFNFGVALFPLHMLVLMPAGWGLGALLGWLGMTRAAGSYRMRRL